MGAPQLIVPGTASGTAPVGGTGTTNTIPRWTGPSTLGDSQLKDNGTLVGIGASLTSGNRLVIGGVASGTSFIKANEATFQIGNIFAGPVQILTSDTPQVTVTGTGNVGFGTASPWSKISAVTANGADTVSVGFSFDSANNYRSGISTNWSSASASGNLMGFLVSNATPTGFTRVMTLNGVGQAAIGTTSFTSGCSLTVAQSIDASQSAQGLKLPATPGNADPQTLDAYREVTPWSPTITYGTGGTVTTTSSSGAYTQIGNVITFTLTVVYNCTVVPTGGAITIDLPRTSASGQNQRPGMWAFNAWNGQAGTNFLSIGSASTTATMRVANATGTADIATYLTVTGAGAFVVTCTYLAS